MHYFVSFLVLQSSWRGREPVALLYVLRMSCYCIFSVTLPYGVVGWSAVCDYGISWSYSLNLLFILLHTFKNTHSYTLFIHVFYSRLQTHFNKVRKVWCFFLKRELTSTNGIIYSFWIQFPFTCENAVIIHSLRCFLIDVKFGLFRFYSLTWRKHKFWFLNMHSRDGIPLSDFLLFKWRI